MEVGSRKLVHVNVTHPTSSWTIQQLREALPSDHAYRWLIHDRSGIFSENVDRAIRSLGMDLQPKDSSVTESASPGQS